MKQHPLCTDTDDGPIILDLPIPEGLKREWLALETRRHFLGNAGKVLGWAAMASLAGDNALTGLAHAAGTTTPSPEFVRLPHFAPKVRRAIYLFQSGGPPQMDLFDYKPNLSQLFDQDIPASVRGNQALTGMTSGQSRFPIAPSYWNFQQYGKSGTWVSDLLPYTAKMVDDLTIVKSINTDAINHEPAIMLMNTGNMNPGKPCLGSWLAYGLGSMNQNLPTFMVMVS